MGKVLDPCQARAVKCRSPPSAPLSLGLQAPTGGKVAVSPGGLAKMDSGLTMVVVILIICCCKWWDSAHVSLTTTQLNICLCSWHCHLDWSHGLTLICKPSHRPLVKAPWRSASRRKVARKNNKSSRRGYNPKGGQKNPKTPSWFTSQGYGAMGSSHINAWLLFKSLNPAVEQWLYKSDAWFSLIDPQFLQISQFHNLTK